MSNQDISKSPFGIKFGVIASLAIIIYGLILNLTGLNTNQALGYVNYFVLAGVMYVACKNYKDANEGFVSFGGAFNISFIVVSIASLISSIFTYVYMAFVDDSILEFIKEKQLEEFEKQGLTDTQIEQAIEMSEMFMTPGMISVMAFIGMLIFGAILGFIVSAIVKNPRPIFE